MKAIRKLTGLVLLAAVTAGCGSTSFVKNTYGTLATFGAAYAVEEPAREAFCKGKVPQPEACTKAYEAAVIGWTAFVESTELLAIYIETRSESARAQIVRLAPEVIASAVELQTVIKELK